MKLRTRVAVALITLLVGWVLASPYRHSLSNADSTPGKNPQASPPSLQIQRTHAQTADSGTEWHNQGWPDGTPALNDPDRPQPLYPTLPAELDRPPRPQRIPLQPVPISNAPTAPRRLRPVSLHIQLSCPTGEAGPHHNHPLAVDEKHHVLRPLSVMPERRRQDSVSAHTRFDLPVSQTWHRIVNGDTLPRLAGTYWGDPQLALLIYEANRDVLVSPEILPIGKELRIPDRSHINGDRRSQLVTTAPDNNASLMPPLMPMPPADRVDSGWRQGSPPTNAHR